MTRSCWKAATSIAFAAAPAPCGEGSEVTKPSYAAAVAGFDWSAVLRDLGWQDRDQIDLGHTIVDRYAGGERAALHWIGKDRSTATVSYRELRALSNRIANLLRGLGVRQGDRVAGVLPRVPETVAVMIGTWKAGGVYVPVRSEERRVGKECRARGW